MIALLMFGSVVAQSGLRTSSVVVDASNPETVYAVGANWKAELCAGGVQFTPFLGADAPKNEYVRFEPSRVSIDGVTLASNADAGVECTGHTLRYARGAFDEVFETRLEGLEHQLVFTALPGRGELSVRCPVDSSLMARQTDDAIEFVNERGGVRYPRAIAFDAAGHRIALATRLDDSALVITVPQEFVANVVLPLTIDPLIQVFGVSTTPAYELAPDAAYQVGQPAGDYRCEVFETAWSLTDHDITARLTPTQGAPVTTLLIDATTEYWSQSKVASVYDSKLSSRFLVVAAAGLPSSGARSIRARAITLTFSGITLGPVTPLGGSLTGDNHHPDVGGDPFNDASGTASYFIIVWQSDQLNGDTDIYRSSFHPLAQPFPIAADPLADDENPRISKSNGVFIWCVVWERRISPTNRDIWASTIAQANPTPSAPVVVSNALEDETNPSVSSAGGPFIIAYERNMGGQRDVFVQRFVTAADPAINFTLLEGGTHLGLDQQWPVVDGDITGYLLAYRDNDPVDPALKRTRLTSFEVTLSNQFVLHEVRHSVGNPGITRTAANVCSHSAAFLTAMPVPRFEVVWDEALSPTNNEVYGAIFLDGAGTGSVTSACYGDGSITACPCAQNGGAPAGCPNSSQATGGELQWTGVADVSTDTFVIHALRLTPNAPVALAGGSAFAANGIVYGDGLLCLSGALTRLVYRVTSPTGTLTYPEFVTDTKISIAGGVSGGVTQSYQLVYRDSPAFCTAGTFNTTNALRVTWAP